MKTHDFFHKVCAADLPDCDAVSAAILARPVAKSRFAARYAAMAAVLTIVVAAGFAALPHLTPTLPDPVPPTVVTAPVEPEKKEPADAAEKPDEPVPEEPETPEEPPVIVFNQLDELSSDWDIARANVFIGEDWIHMWSLSQVQDYLGRDPVAFLEPPDGLVPCFNENSYWQYAKAPDGREVLAQFQFSWREQPDREDYDPLERHLSVTVAKREIFTCGIIVDDDRMKPSIIRGTTLYLGERQMPYGPYTVVEDGPNIPAGYYDCYVAKFEYDGLNYYVESDSLTKGEFIAALKDLLTDD